MGKLINDSLQVLVFTASFILAIFLGPAVIPALAKIRFRQVVRDDGPASHLKKMGTPTIGGIIFLIPLTVVSLIYSLYDSRILPVLLATLGFGAVGFIDDYLKAAKRKKDGMSARQKMLGLLIVAAVFTAYVANRGDLGVDVMIPFIGVVSSRWFFMIFTVFVFLAVTNAVNLTDGLDGLAAGMSLIIMIFFTVVAMTRAEWSYLKVFCASLAGGCLGFLAFNMYPARVFMGDTGSLALGGAIGAAAVLMKMPFIILLVGALFVIEALSVMIQVLYFKKTGRRVFKMAPIHHHLELSGWKETKVVTVFWLITLVLCLTGFFLLMS